MGAGKVRKKMMKRGEPVDDKNSESRHENSRMIIKLYTHKIFFFILFNKQEILCYWYIFINSMFFFLLNFLYWPVKITSVNSLYFQGTALTSIVIQITILVKIQIIWLRILIVASHIFTCQNIYCCCISPNLYVHNKNEKAKHDH